MNTKPPPVNLVLNSAALDALREKIGQPVLVGLIREAIANATEFPGSVKESAEIVAQTVADTARRFQLPSRRRINATGIIIHTGWGNAQLHSDVIERLAEAAGATETGGKDAPARTEMCAAYIRELTGAEAASVITMNAPAYVLLAGALAKDKEIIVAARDLVEISEGARIRDIIEAGGARVVPVGSANCVYADDYQRAIGPDTAMILRIHASNLASTGYVAHVAGTELARLAREHDLIYAENLGGGSLVDLTDKNLPWCPTLQQSLQDGADVVFASGDKIIGGPQAGIIAGRRGVVSALMKHPLSRICRPGKLTLAALEVTLARYAAGRAWAEIPTLRLLAEPVADLETRAAAMAGALMRHGFNAQVLADEAECGGAVLPGVMLPTFTVQITQAGCSEDELHRELLIGGVVARRKQASVVLDLRSVLPEDDARLIDSVVSIIS